MTLLTWNHACTVGVRALDDQHGILMDTMNELRLALVHGSGRDKVSDLLGQLVEFTRMHFSSEERVLEQHGFPGLSAHRAEHRRLLGQIEETAHRAQHSEELGMRQLLNFLRDWYVGHIEGADQQYGPWLNQRGIY